MTTRLPFSRAFVPFCFAAFILVAGACVAAQAPAGATDALTQVMQMRGFAEPFVPLQPNPAAKDSAALVAVLKQHLAARAERRTDFEALEKYLAQYPDSPWRLSLLLNLGLEYYDHGYFSRALNAWKGAWEAGATATTPQASALADRAFAEWVKMLSRIGRTAELGRALETVKDRPFRGMSAEMVATARDSFATMTARPGIAYRCGPHALERILAYTQAGRGMPPELVNSESSPKGIALASVAALAKDIGLPMQVAKRSPGAVLPLPAVAHWKVEHYGAILKHENGRYLLDDPTFANGLLWITENAIDAEGSGYFLIPAGPLPTGWIAVSDEEAATIWGRGYPNADTPGSTGPGNPSSGDDDDDCGMAVWSVYLMMCSLNLSDTPIGYQPPIGPAVSFGLNYSQRETNQPAVINYSNFGPRWNFNWIGSLTFDSANAYYNRGEGGIEVFTGFNSATQSYAPNYQLGDQLVRISATHYELRQPNGGKVVFTLPDSANAPTRIFLTQVVDPQGNAVTISYDGTFRVTKVTDAIGQESTLSYDVAGAPYLVTKITDPFGRFATFEYNANRQLIKITDVIGMTSEFTYNASDTILTLKTGYGTTSFAVGGTNGSNRFVEVTHPSGDKERFEQRNGATPGIPFSEPANLVPQGIPLWNQYLDGRNTVHWDRKAMKEGPGDGSKARIYHFMHQDLNSRSPVLESIKFPNENRVWYKYQGQNNIGFYSYGMFGGAPAVVARVLENGSTQLYQTSYNAQGQITKTVDPLGRELTFSYAANGTDLVEVRRKTGEGSSVRVLAVTYGPQHLPLALIGADGQATTYTYNARGQLLTTTNALGQTITYTYNAQGYPTKVDGPLAGATDAFTMTYDAFGRLSTWTGTDGYVLSYTYDALDRLTRVTFPDGTFQETTWTLLQPTTVKDRRGHITQYTYDSLKQIVSELDPLGRVTRFAWCRCGSLSAVIDPLGRQTSWKRDVSGRAIGKIYPDGSMETYAYDATGRMKSKTDTKGQTKVFEWTMDDELESMTYLNTSVPTPGVRYTYDKWFPRKTQRLDGAGISRVSYYPHNDPPSASAGLIKSIDGPFADDTIEFEYDGLGRLEKRSLNGAFQKYTRDPLARVTNVENPLGVFTYAYVGATPRPASIAMPNGNLTEFDYLPATADFLLKQVWHKRSTGATLSKFDYEYNADQMISEWTQTRNANPARVHSLTYDLGDQLTAVTATNPAQTFTYTHDLAGNRLTESIDGATATASFNALNEITSISTNAQAARTYEWDGEDRLIAINYTGTNLRTEFTYDGLNRRVRVVEKNGATISSERRYVWFRKFICEERDENNQVLKRLYPQGEQAGANSFYYTRDHLGSICDLADGTGAPRAQYSYDPYGRQQKLSGDLEASFGFTGHFRHPASNLVLAPLRAYDPALGRWISRDPIGEDGGLNLYAYVGNDPVNYIDPDGTEGFKIPISEWDQFLEDHPIINEIIKKGLEEGFDKLADKVDPTGYGKKLGEIITTIFPPNIHVPRPKPQPKPKPKPTPKPTPKPNPNPKPPYDPAPPCPPKPPTPPNKPPGKNPPHTSPKPVPPPGPPLTPIHGPTPPWVVDVYLGAEHTQVSF